MKNALIVLVIIVGLVTFFGGSLYWATSADEARRDTVEYWNERAANAERSRYILCQSYLKWSSKGYGLEPTLEKRCRDK